MRERGTGAPPAGASEGDPLDVADLVERAEGALEAGHRVAPGRFRRVRPEPGGRGERAPDPYGCADAANLLYTLGRMPRDAAERGACVEALRELQRPEDGLYREGTHHPWHTTAHCVAALELFDAGPRQPLRGLAAWAEPAAMEGLLESLDWAGSPWLEAHRGAGLFAALVLAGEPPVSAAWRER